MATTRTVTMWTTGEYMTTTIRDLISSGHFYNAIEVLKDGGAPNDIIKGFLTGRQHLTGDTRTEEGLQIEECEQHLMDGMDLMITGWASFCTTYKNKNGDHRPLETYEFDTIRRYLENKDNRHLTSLFSIFTVEEFIAAYAKDIVSKDGYTITNLDDQTPIEKIRDGVILEDGTFIEVKYECHRYLYPILEQLNLSDNDGDEWGHKERKCIRISDYRVCGKVATIIASDLEIDSYKGITVTQEQIKALFKWREHFPKMFSDRDGTVMNCVRDYIIRTEDKGAKWGNLKFLEMFNYTKTPKISMNPLEGKYALRTSPNKSMAGILDSKFNVTKEKHEENVSDMMLVWGKYKDLMDDNNLHIFSQEYVDGKNGVCHYKEKCDFEYSISEKRGDVVNGIDDGVSILSNDEYNYLRTLSRTLYRDLGEQIQLEYVCNPTGVTIVQLRTIDTPIEEDVIDPNGKVIGTGRSFRTGTGYFSKNETLIVDSQCDSKELIGKKCLIVREMVDFSHALSLSLTLKIPSIYGIGDVEIPEEFYLDTTKRTGVITINRDENK